MKKYITLICSFLLFLTSCTYQPRLKLCNNTGHDIVIELNNKITKLASGAVKTMWIDGYSLSLSVSNDQKVWNYSTLGLDDIPEKYRPYTSIIIHAQIEHDGLIYLFPPGTKFPQNDLSTQSDNFMIKPLKM